jgi:molybdopterin-guanine dinucleotide biosynthesis protein MobB
MRDIPVLSIVGTSGSGKTTLLEKLIAELERRGYRVGVIKHHPHPGLETDVPGKDTWRMAQAGAMEVVLATPDWLVHRRRMEGDPPLSEVVKAVHDVDLILVEGYKREPGPKIEVNRRAHHPALISPPEDLVAVVSDRRFGIAVPQFGLEDVEELADWIEQRFIT